jgi:hypothetical protein
MRATADVLANHLGALDLDEENGRELPVHPEGRFTDSPVWSPRLPGAQ